MSGPFIQRVVELSGKSEQELATEAFDEFRRISLHSVDSTVPFEAIANCMTLLAVALKWVEKPRVYSRVMTDGVQLRDSIG